MPATTITTSAPGIPPKKKDEEKVNDIEETKKDEGQAEEQTEQSSETQGQEVQDKDTQNQDGQNQDGQQEDPADDVPIYTQKQLTAILERQKKKHDDDDGDNVESKLEEARKQGIEEGRIEQRRQSVAEEYGFSKDVIPQTMKGIDDFITGIQNYQANHRRNIVTARPTAPKPKLVAGFVKPAEAQ